LIEKRLIGRQPQELLEEMGSAGRLKVCSEAAFVEL
jgi:hypothetical protein